MATIYRFKIIYWISFIILFIQNQNEAHASHAQSADLTYKCLGGNQYEISLSFYRDCAGVAAPNSVTINFTSVSCNQNFNATIFPINGTGNEVTPICNANQSQCSGGTNPGVQEFIYRGNVTLPQQCADWVFSFTLCCRNASITTINNPSAENIYVQATLDNLNFTCNNSPTFSNAPIPFVCVGQNFCFNHGATDIDGDSLTYQLVAPGTGPNTTVTYINPYTPTQPLNSSPPVTFNPSNGDICMTPQAIQVTVLAVLVREWRNGQMVGSVTRDVQVRTMTCTNNLPYINGINGSGTYSASICANKPFSFFTNSFDADANQTVTLSWNGAITGATFTSSGGTKPTGTFTWTPGVNDISNTPHCFTVTVQDNNCPYYGSQTFAFCILVSGISLNVASTNANCGASNGTASVTATMGTSPYTYSWSSGSNNANANGLQAGTYTVTVTDITGCSTSATVAVGPGSMPSNVSITATSVLCFGANNGVATVNANGGQQPYTYQWSNSATTQTATGLAPGTYTVVVTTANGCTSSVSVMITQPASALAVTQSQTNVLCNGATNGSASLNVSGGTAGYTYVWSNGQNGASATGLAAGNYSATVTDANGCSATATFSIVQPQVLAAGTLTINNVSCNGGNNGFVIAAVSGGTGAYTYSWSSGQNSQSASNLVAGTYTVTVTDANGCSATASIVVTQPTLISLYYTQYNVLCNGGANGSVTVSPSGGNGNYTYSWSNGGNNSSANGLAAGNYTLSVTDSKGCKATQLINITQPAPLAAAITQNNVLCNGASTGSASANPSGGTSPFTYSWSNGAITQQAANMAAGSYTVKITDANGCFVTAAVSITQPVAMSVVASKPAPSCFGQNVTIGAVPSGGTGNYTYSWSPGAFTTSTVAVSPSVTTVYTVTVTDNCGAAVTGTVNLVINAVPVVSLTPQSGTGCDEVTFNFINPPTANTNYAHYWDFGDGTGTSAKSPSHAYDKNGVYTVVLTVTSTQGCNATGSTTVTVNVNTSPVADFSMESEVISWIYPVAKFRNSSLNATSWLWDFGDKTTSTLKDPQHTYKAKGTYTVIMRAYNQSVCTDSMVKTVEVEPEFTFYIPNCFTPNSDGKNDLFTGKGDEIKAFNMTIFNRWGEEIFYTEDMIKGWDGRAKGGDEKAQFDVYVYKVEVRDVKNKMHYYVGHVTLLN